MNADNLLEGLPISIRLAISIRAYLAVPRVDVFRRDDVELLAEVRLSAIKDQAHFLRIYHALQDTAPEESK